VLWLVTLPDSVCDDFRVSLQVHQTGDALLERQHLLLWQLLAVAAVDEQERSEGEVKLRRVLQVRLERLPGQLLSARGLELGDELGAAPHLREGHLSLPQGHYELEDDAAHDLGDGAEGLGLVHENCCPFGT
jgi:hypothetical protein